MATNRTYEVMYIVNPETADDAIGTLNDTMGRLIETEGGTIIRRDDIGRRRMAYEINKKKEGYYVLFEIEGSGQEIAELERRMRVNDAIIRFITVRVDEDRKTAEKHKAKREARHGRRDAESASRNQRSDTADATAENQ